MRTSSLRCLFHTCRPVYRGLVSTTRTAPFDQATPLRCRLRVRSCADGLSTPSAVRASAIARSPRPPTSARPLSRTFRGTTAGSGFWFSGVADEPPPVVRRAVVRVLHGEGAVGGGVVLDGQQLAA